jgi:hypothetical protein
MNRSTLALAYAAKTAKTAGEQPRQGIPTGIARDAAMVPAAVRAPESRSRMTPEPISEDALLIAVRRSLASCRDTSHRRMLAAFEAMR